MAAFVIEAERIMEAPVDIVWAVVSDAGKYHVVADTLARSDIVSGDGLGMVRNCVDSRGREWNETCSSWTPGEAFTMRVEVATYPASFRAIFRSVQGTWIVTPEEDGTRVTVRFEGDTKLGPLGRAAVAAMGRDSVLGGILDGYEHLVQESLKRS